jgi:hypothetical protein
MRLLVGALAGAFFTAAIFAAQDEHHYECTEIVPNEDGGECVGDIVQVPGPDRQEIVGFAFAGGVVLLFGMAYDDEP